MNQALDTSRLRPGILTRQDLTSKLLELVKDRGHKKGRPEGRPLTLRACVYAYNVRPSMVSSRNPLGTSTVAVSPSRSARSKQRAQ
jgi:hypothetical protein